jgi:hypothetical protein
MDFKTGIVCVELSDEMADIVLIDTVHQTKLLQAPNINRDSIN